MFSRYTQFFAHRAFASAAGAGKSVGFVGLGCMGVPMAGNLKAAGFNVKGYDIMPAARQAANDHGVETVDSLAEAASNVDYVVTALPKTEHVEEALTGAGGIFQSARKGTLICDVSTIDPEGSKRFNKQAKELGLTFLDTPMSGGTTGAENATLTFMVGADTEAEYEAAKVVLNGMGKNFFHCGGPGTGEIAKLTNNLVLGITMVGTAEGMAIGEKLGIDPIILQKIMAVSSARSWSLDVMCPRPGCIPTSPSSNDYKGGFQVGLIKKDMHLATECARKVDADTSILEFAKDYYQQLEDRGAGGKDFGYVFQYIMKNKNL